MFAATASLCNVFQGKCAQHIKDGAEANFFILTHMEPIPETEKKAKPGSSDLEDPLLPVEQTPSKRPSVVETIKRKSGEFAHGVHEVVKDFKEEASMFSTAARS